jgi:hypothetical protein
MLLFEKIVQNTRGSTYHLLGPLRGIFVEWTLALKMYVLGPYYYELYPMDITNLLIGE